MSLDTPGDTPTEPVTPALLGGVAGDLRTDALDAPETLKRVWSGLRLARLLGLRLASTGPEWRQRQMNAASVEHQLTRDLGTTATFAGTTLTLPDDPTPRPLADDEVDGALEALVEFSAAARHRMLAAAARAPHWHDERVLRHDSLVVRQLGEAWLGNRASYRVDSR